MVPTNYVPLPTQADVITSAIDGITAKTNVERVAGNCWKQTRLRLAKAGVPLSLIPPIGVDSNGAAHWYRANHPELIVGNGSVPGDVLFYEVGHGPHGHVGTRIPGNELAENSTAHAPEGEVDGRGVRPLDRVGTPTLAVRFWRNK